MNFIKKLLGFSDSLPKKKGNTKDIVRFQKTDNNDSPIKVGDKVKLWNKPNSDLVNIYAKGSLGGDGLIGFSNNKSIAHHLQKSGLYIAEINSLGENDVFVKVSLKNEFKTKEDFQSEQSLRWKNDLLKPYNPKKGWTLRFLLKDKLTDKNKLRIGFKRVEDVLLTLEHLESNIWLENSDGVVLSEKNLSGTVDTIKTLRTIYSEKEFSIECDKRKGSGNYYFFTLEI